MKWKYTLKNKVLASATLLSLCLLVLLSNYIDRNHTKNVKTAISTLYEDRLIAEDYILRMTISLYKIKEIINSDSNTSDKNNSVKKLYSSIKETNDAYHTTKFTELEKITAAELMKSLVEIELSQQKTDQFKLEAADKALGILYELSKIQLAESKQIMNYAEKLYLSGKTSSEYVFALIIIILIVLQALVFTSKTYIPKVISKYPDLN